METETPDAQPKKEIAKTEEQGGESQKGPAALLPVAEVIHSEAKESDTEEGKDETDREQDEAIDKLAENTELIAQQTKWERMQGIWVRNQFWASAALGLFTLLVLAYQSVKMSGQLEATNETVKVMRDQLKAMESSSQQTQDLINATRETANASQSVAEQNRELVKHAGKQAEALAAQVSVAKTQANASQTQANASKAMVGQTARLVNSAEVQAGAMREQAGTALRQLEITDRPWLNFEAVPKGTLIFRSGDAMLHVHLTVNNVGRSVAKQVVVMADLFVGKSGEDVFGKAFERQRQICEETATNITHHTVLPGGSFAEGRFLKAEMSAIERGRGADSNDLPFFLIIGCATYRFGDQLTLHHTNFVYDVLGPGGSPIQIGQDISVRDLTLIKNSEGGDDAN